MADLVPEYLTFDYRCHFRGIPGAHHDPEDYPVFWTVKIKATVWEDDNDDSEGKEVSVGEAHLYVVPDAGVIELFLTLDAVSQEVANVGEMLTINRPDLIEDMALGGDLLVLSSLRIAPKFRGNKLGHAILKAILCTVGRSASKVILEAAPVLTKDAPIEGTAEHDAAKVALRLYWEGFGFQPAHGDYLVFDDMADVLD
ncbi:UNVERIFIED_ORG: GNAT superfamily N-acetyltransferase [Arthrobacter sp. UYCu721]